MAEGSVHRKQLGQATYHFTPVQAKSTTQPDDKLLRAKPHGLQIQLEGSDSQGQKHMRQGGGTQEQCKEGITSARKA